MAVTVQHLYDANRDSLGLSWLAGQQGADRLIDTSGRASSDMVGYLNLIHPTRLHVLGNAETAYYDRLDDAKHQTILADLVAGRPPALIVAEGAVPDPLLIDCCENDRLPVLRSPLPPAEVIDALRYWLAKAVAESSSMHGVFMDVLGMGVLISGESGLGKSELALELISRGHGLVADDVVDFKRIAPHAIEGRCPALLRNMLEVRGLGLLDIRAIFGETAIRPKMKLKLIVHLVRRSTLENEYQRLPLEALTEEVLGLPIRKVVIPVAAGRNMAVLTEAAVRSAVLSLRGFDTMGEFIARQHELIGNSAQ
ncbi:MAG: HPr kinase/phosphorylase [Burkholderiaceae bacterium]|nr:HPr kinase/phosphorylase [Burkholderiaceae bacterium]